MKRLDKKKVRALHVNIIRWYRKHRRELQWRKTDNPYEILVSEIMLQQTQVSRVKEKLPRFLKTFPTFHVLANSSAADVIRAWDGIGYNNRAVRLRNLARIVVDKHRGRLPSEIVGLQSLPGIGPYTAHAVGCFVFRKRVPVVDVNVRRVLSRVFWKMNTRGETKHDSEIRQLAGYILPSDAYAWNQALMDLGATICTARKPLCSLCPILRQCRSKTLGSMIHSRLDNQNVNTEPSYRGLPRRIWRGKIIQTLRDIPHRRTISLSSVGRAIKLGQKDSSWLANVVRQLERDGLIITKRTRNQTYLSLAA